MGIISSTVGYYMTRTNDPNPITTLTSRDIYVVQNSWVPFKKDLTASGVALLLLFFDLYPEEKRHFAFKDIPKAELKDNKKFQAHCNSVMTAVDALVTNINDGELIASLLEKLGKNHKRHEIATVSFDHLTVTLVELFKPVMKEHEIETWKKLLHVAFSVIGNEL